jgi:hypothetical protein
MTKSSKTCLPKLLHKHLRHFCRIKKMLTRQGQHSKRTIETETFDCNSTYQIYICYSFFNLTNDPTTFSSKLVYTNATFIFLKVFLP